MLASEHIEGERGDPISPLAEPVERDRLRPFQRVPKVALGQRRLSAVEQDPEQPRLVRPAMLFGPIRVRLVLQQLPPVSERDRRRPQPARSAGRGALGTLRQLVKAVDIEIHALRGDPEPPGSVTISARPPRPGASRRRNTDT